jgi:Fe-S cluster assembly ATP-binding protein
MALEIKKLNVELAATGGEILQDIDLEVEKGEVHVVMGPNGSGKSSLAKTLSGHPDYKVSSGDIVLDGEDITKAEPNIRALSGLFLASQYPVEIPGVSLTNFLRIAYNNRKSESEQLSVYQFRKLLREKLAEVGLAENFINRNLNEGFSGGEKKKCEILQLSLFDPKYAILDETDSGLDVDAIRTVFGKLKEVILQRKNMGVLIITHYQRVFDYITPNKVHILLKGRIVKSGGMELARKIEADGYNWLIEEINEG